MNKIPTIVLVLRSGGDFKFRDVELIARHINGEWQSEVRPRIICLWDKASESYDLGNIEILPLKNDYPGTWARMDLYSPEMEQYRPFLYIDLDTAVIQSLEKIFKLVIDPSMFITLEDFWQRGDLATGLVWFPAKSEKISNVWKAWCRKDKDRFGFRMDYFLRMVVQPDLFWQQLTVDIHDFKPRHTPILSQVPKDATLICFHGKPRIFQVAEASVSLDWVKNYVEADYGKAKIRRRVTVIIPYKIDRGWLQDAVNSVPKDIQLLVSQGEGNWPSNFNKAFPLAEGDYVRYLHEDDMLTPNCIEDSVKAIEEQGVDFIHGNAFELSERTKNTIIYKPAVLIPTVEDLLKKNVIHSTTLMYKREIFEKLGGFDESLNVMEEYEFSLRCLKAGFKIGYCNSTLAVYRRHPAQKVRTVPMEEKRKEKELVNSNYLT